MTHHATESQTRKALIDTALARANGFQLTGDLLPG